MPVEFHMTGPKQDGTSKLISGTLYCSVNDNTRWDILSEAIEELDNRWHSETDTRTVSIPRNILSWIMNAQPEFVYLTTSNVTIIFKLNVMYLRYLKGTDIQIALGKYTITDGGYL
jgi:hypothetical protein